ncbi:MAG: hypothetical protein EWV55_20185 [Microcystis viridis Mv_BB_P_19951000_S69]|uniref:Uncharacterized protein n=1 Tax=Microcystis viridis Mv_BB_P_19951000_S68D TaxID=2486270 RepID=A0A552I279_MICVR|nr:MAG: hypothetical protein EWV55_20185 [Microcystis viridis Mv_BB_P_19951000_S69]TRU77573.1 MAG: hypothetical protein EWV77_05510 [Microcystis viridis Mv_BB_P_19951000_S68D]TRU78316.1 MAG: hypothetical protein EWV47_02140 [Microcystis viridis Mv_BB_P_19951000_S68]TRU83701.1 MAG: hypothetical protein EWV46_16030 [Microcystis viridis Mv_BB_P_19951000_S69D]
MIQSVCCCFFLALHGNGDGREFQGNIDRIHSLAFPSKKQVKNHCIAGVGKSVISYQLSDVSFQFTNCCSLCR